MPRRVRRIDLKPHDFLDRHSAGGKLTIDPTAAVRPGVSIDHSADVTIGAHTVVCEDVLILTHLHDIADPFDKSRCTYSPLVIGERCFIGERATILPQVTSIGDEAVIGACAVVTHDVPAGETWVGNPARRRP